MSATETTLANVPAEAAPAMTPRDFPSWLPPMLVKELRQGLRTRGFVLALVIFQLVMLLLTLGAFASQNTAAAAARASVGVAVSTSLFWAILGAQLVLITPARAVGGLQLEVDARTIDLLLLTRLDAWRIVLGKWVSLLAQALLLLIAMLPYLVVRYFSDNADLVAEFLDCLALLGACAVLTAAGLWASALSRVLRVVIVIILVFSLQGFTGFFAAMRGSTGAAWLRGFSVVDVANGALVAAFFLVNAVRNIAPRAENHAFFVRVLPLIALAAAPVLDGIGAHDIAVRQLFFAGGFLALVLLIELASTRVPMAAQWREWRRRGPLFATAGLGSLPGWPSAFAYLVVAGGGWILATLLVYPDGSAAARATAEHAAWMAYLAVAALAGAAALQSLVRGGRIEARIVFLGGVIVPVVLTVVAVWLAESRVHFTMARTLMELVPGASLLFAINPQAFAGEPALPAWVPPAQAAISAAVLLGTAWLTRPYWQLLALFEARDRAGRASG